MTLTEIMTMSKNFTDENPADDFVIKTANRCLYRVNSECGTSFPKFTSVSTEYTSMPGDELATLVTSYLSYGIKMSDGSIREAGMYLDEFGEALRFFKSNLGKLVDSYVEGDPESGINPELVSADGQGGVYSVDMSNAMDVGFFTSGTNGGSF